MLRIRLLRTGKRNAADFRIVVVPQTAPPQGKFLEVVGNYNPRLKQVSFKKERIEYWLSQGAQPSDTVYNLMVSQGILKGPKKPIKIGKSKKKEETEKSVETKGAEEKPEEKVEEKSTEEKSEENQKENKEENKEKENKEEQSN